LGQDENAPALEGLSLEAELRRALEQDEFRLHYQPKVDLRTGQVTGVETLIRWQHPKLGMISPHRFIPIAEESDLIFGLGEWVLRGACSQLHAWQQEGLELQVAVNVSARQFCDPKLADLVVAVMADSHVDPRLVEIELTETAIMPDASASILTLESLESRGVSISIDNFGTGYSSLSYLARIPTKTVQIDRSFVCEVNSDEERAAIVRATIEMAHTLGIRVLAEGVETEEQLAFLSRYGCDMMQGYLFSKPLPLDELAELLRQGRSLPLAKTA
jgi:EAL domain-containing protein (putative c-di-GMP-specific phosphodiesterase class I)